jgi:hypothetical protein
MMTIFRQVVLSRVRLSLAVTVIATILVLSAGVLAGLLGPTEAKAGDPVMCNGNGGPPGSYCGCPYYPPCDENDDGWAYFDIATRTAALDVYHETTGAAVQPVVGETWTITVTWRADDSVADPDAPCPCDDRVEVVEAEVYWDDSDDEWKVTCDDCNSTYSSSNPGGAHYIYEVDVCTTWDCFPDEDQSSQYELIVNVLEVIDNCGEGVNIDPDPPGADGTHHYLHAVEFATTEVDDGRSMNGSCVLGSTVEPTSQEWTAVDLGRAAANSGYAFECPFDCTANGPDVTITYE